MPLDADTPLRFVKGIGPQRAELLRAAGFETALDLLSLLPLRYEDRRRLTPLASVQAPGPWAVVCRLEEVRQIRTRRRSLSIVRARAHDESGTLPVVWFNRPYLSRQLDPATTYLLYGPARPSEGMLWELMNPACEPFGAESTRALVPIYPAVRGLGPATTRRLVARVVELLDDPSAIPETVPEQLRRRYALPPLGEALAALHRPSSDSSLDELTVRGGGARARLVYGELLDLQVELALVRSAHEQRPKPHRYRIDDEVRAVARGILPFRLTPAQRRVLKEIVDDMQRPSPMLRLLQGDVGSGKTIVAALALAVAIESGLQGAFMAPTELLAEQHAGTFARLLGARYRIALVSSSRPSAALREELAAGSVQLAIGTHALLEGEVRFARLGLAVIDEQHRFGVEQRLRLQAKGTNPDLLVMTATPIPRSLALTAWGDLEISNLDELPPGRTPVRTEVVPSAQRREVYRRLREELAAGAQAYVVVPLIDESDQVAAASLAELGERVRQALAEFPTAMLHGRVGAEQREATMRAFAAGELRVLIATSLIEVGLDVPSASVMVIESAERFGLAQLHQLRGRVGRGSRPSLCFAVHGRLSEEGRRRLEVFASCNDGFRLAEADLEIRGPGDVLGTRQSGLPTFRLANPLLDREWLERARADAREIVAQPREPQFAALISRLTPRAVARAGRLGAG